MKKRYKRIINALISNTIKLNSKVTELELELLRDKSRNLKIDLINKCQESSPRHSSPKPSNDSFIESYLELIKNTGNISDCSSIGDIDEPATE